MPDVTKIGTNRNEARRFLYEAATLWNAISDDGLNNSKHVDDFRKGLKTFIFQKYFYFGTQPVYFLFLVLVICM